MKSCSRRHFLKVGSAALAATSFASFIPFHSALAAANWQRLKAQGQGKRVFITGSTSGIGLVAAKQLIAQGHRVVAHARNAKRANDVRRELAGVEAIILGDLAEMQQVQNMAKQLNQMGRFDAVIQNAGIYSRASRDPVAGDIPQIFMVNTLAPYVLTALMERPERIIFVSSSYHQGADIDLDDITWKQRAWSGYEAYASSKFYDALLAKALARHWPKHYINAIRPGWVPTHMGGAGAPDDLEQGAFTQSFLAVSDEASAHVSGKFFFHMRKQHADPRLNDTELQDRFLAECATLSHIPMPYIESNPPV